MTATLLSDLIEHQIGGGWGAEEASTLTPDPAFVIRGTDIPSALVGDVSGVPFRFHKSSNLRSRALQHLDIVFEVSGGSKGQPVGRALLVTNRLLEQFDETPAMCASFCKLIRLSAEHCDPRFVFRLLQAAYSDGSLDAFQVQSTGITNFRWKPFLDQYQVVLPTPRTQNQVAEVLGAIDELIENNRRRVAVLEEMARAIYREWFVHFRFPGHEDATFVDSDLGPIPEGWAVRPLGAVATADRRSVQPNKQPSTWFDHYSLPAFDDGMLPALEIGESIRSGKYVVDHPAVMVSKLNPRIPRTWLVDPDGVRPGISSTEFVILSPCGGRSIEWVFTTVTAPPFQDRMQELSGGTSTSHQRLRPAAMLAIPVIDPPADLISRVTDVLRPSLTATLRLRKQNKYLAGIRDLLLPKLVTGQIDVSDLDLDALVEGAGV